MALLHRQGQRRQARGIGLVDLGPISQQQRHDLLVVRRDGHHEREPVPIGLVDVGAAVDGALHRRRFSPLGHEVESVGVEGPGRGCAPRRGLAWCGHDVGCPFVGGLVLSRWLPARRRPVAMDGLPRCVVHERLRRACRRALCQSVARLAGPEASGTDGDYLRDVSIPSRALDDMARSPFVSLQIKNAIETLRA